MAKQRGRATATIKLVIRNHYGNRCQDCGHVPAEGEDNLDVHRIVHGSRYSIEGCMVLCCKCHRRRHRKQIKAVSLGASKFSIELPPELRDHVFAAAAAEKMTPKEWLVAIAAVKVGQPDLAWVWAWNPECIGPIRNG